MSPIVRHVVVDVILFILGIVVGNFVGYDRGFERGEKAGIGKGYEEAYAKATPKAVEQKVQEQYRQELEEREATGERGGYRRGLTAGQNACALEMFYSIFKRKVQDAVEATTRERTEDRILQMAQAIITTRNMGLTRLGEIAQNVLDGLIDQLQEAVQSGDAAMSEKILEEIAGTMEGRDATFQRALESLRSAK
jgi:hypothetical protein